MLTNKQKRYLYVPPKPTDMVVATAEPLTSIPPGSNPFHHDAYHMGSMLVRDWMVMHEGPAHPENPKGLEYLILVNIASGQRIQIQLHTEEEQPRPIIHLLEEQYPDKEDQETSPVFFWVAIGDELTWEPLLVHNRRRRPPVHYVFMGDTAMVHAETFRDHAAYLVACEDDNVDPLDLDAYTALLAKVEAFYEAWSTPH